MVELVGIEPTTHRCDRCSTPLLRADSTRLTVKTSTQNGDLLEHDWNINRWVQSRQFVNGSKHVFISQEFTNLQTGQLSIGNSLPLIATGQSCQNRAGATTPRPRSLN